MSNIRCVDILFLDELFEMCGGYVLNFQDSTMSRFFAETNGTVEMLKTSRSRQNYRRRSGSQLRSE
jgi:hypothetical protein